MFSELKKDLRNMTRKSSMQSINEYLTLRESTEETISMSDEQEIDRIADSLPETDINNDPDIEEVIERFIPKAKL